MKRKVRPRAAATTIRALCVLVWGGTTSVAAAQAPPATSSTSATAAAVPPARYTSRGVVLTVASDNLILARAGQDIPWWSYRAWQEAKFKADVTAATKTGGPGDLAGCTRAIEAQPLAWNGSFLSLRETIVTSCPREAHPAGESRFVTWALGKGAEAADALTPVSLDAWLAPAVIFEALRRDSVVRAALAHGPAADPPRTLAELLARLAEAEPVADPPRACYAFPEDLLQRFVPDHVQQGKLAVRLGLPGNGVCRTRLTELGILVALPPTLRTNLLPAASGRGGFLRANAPPELRGRKVVFTLGPL